MTKQEIKVITNFITFIMFSYFFVQKFILVSTFWQSNFELLTARHGIYVNSHFARDLAVVDKLLNKVQSGSYRRCQLILFRSGGK